MAGLSPGTSGEPPSVSSWERGSAHEAACPSPCDRGCARGECTFNLPKSIRINFPRDWGDNPYLRVRPWGSDSEEIEREVALDKCVHTISSSTEVEKVEIYIQQSCFFKAVLALLVAMKNIPSLESLTVFDIYSSELSVSDAEAIFSVLRANNTLQKCKIQFSRYDPTEAAIVKVMVDALLQNQVLKEFELTIHGSAQVSGRASEQLTLESSLMKELSRYSKAPSNVLTKMLALELIDGEVIELANLLGANKKLQRLSIWTADSPHGEGTGRIGDALHTNSTLEGLCIWGKRRMEIEEMKALVGALIPDATSGHQPNTSLYALGLRGGTIKGKEGMEQLAILVRSNTSLLSLHLDHLSILCSEDENAVEYAEMLFTVLRFNASLELLDLRYCTGMRGKQVLGMIMDMLLHNQTLREIRLDGTGMEKDGDAEVVYAEFRVRNKDVDRDLEKVVESMERVAPTSARVFLCGNPEAGKTTLCQRWKKIHDMQSKHFPLERREHSIFHKMFSCIMTKPKEKFESENLSTSSLPLERTRGIEVHNMIWKGMKVSMWDMAGQHEYHAFHDMVVPNQSAKGECCFYLIVCDPSKHWHSAKDGGNANLSIKLKEEIGYWLMFLASNTRRSESYRPHVTILLTHHDVWKYDDWLLDDLFEDIIHEFREKFQAFLDFDNDLFFIKMANMSQESQNDVVDAEMVQHRIEEYFEQLSLKLPKVLRVSEEMQIKLVEWLKEHPNDYILKWEKFSEDVFGGVQQSLNWRNDDEELLEKVKKRIATSLHSGGHIMYFEDIGVVIMDPHWFCNKIMGNILFNCTTLIGVSEKASNGIIPREKLKKVVDKEMHDAMMGVHHFDNILKVMTQLQICYEDDGGLIIIPSVLKDVSYTIDWNEHFSTSNGPYHYIGTSLKTQDNTITLPTAGFFPRLEAYLHNEYVSNPSYRICFNVISFISENGIDVFVILKEGSINILSRSVAGKKYYDHALHKTIINYINDLRQKPTLGCPGVVFEENIIRPESVENPSKKRLQSVSKKHLKEMVLRTGDVDHKHIWEVDEESRCGCDSTRELLGEEEWQNILESRVKMVQEMNKDVDKILLSSDDMHTMQSSLILDEASCSNTHISSDPHEAFMARRFHSMKKLIQGNHKEVQGNHKEVMERLFAMEKKIINSQETLTARVCSNIDHLMESILLLKNSDIPKLPYITRSDRTSGKRILLKMVPGLTTYHLQFRCEHNDHFFHTVDNQPGCEISIGNDTTRKFGVVMFWGLTISVMLLKVGAHVAAGVGSMVPDLTRELATVLDTPGLLDLAQPKGDILECLPADFKHNRAISLEDNEQAKAWLEMLLASKKKSKSMYDMFKLSQVEYTSKSSKRKEIGWVCDAHRK